jgi:hypothetical protein
MTGAAVDGSFILRLTVTIHTPTHAQTGNLLHFFHFLHIAVTDRTILTGFDVRSVIELHVIGQQMNLLPSNGLVVVESIGNLLDVRAVRFHDYVAIHANIQ